MSHYGYIVSAQRCRGLDVPWDTHRQCLAIAAGYVMIREAIEDTVLTIPSKLGKLGNRSIAIQKGAQVVVDMVGVRKCLLPLANIISLTHP